MTYAGITFFTNHSQNSDYKKLIFHFWNAVVELHFYTIYHPICIYRYRNGYKVRSMCVYKTISKRAKTDLSLFNVILYPILALRIFYILYANTKSSALMHTKRVESSVDLPKFTFI